MPGQGQAPSSLNDAFFAATEADWLAAVSRANGGRPLNSIGDAGGHDPVWPLYGPHNAAPPIGTSRPFDRPRLRSHIADPSPVRANGAIRDEIAGGAQEIVLDVAAPGSPGCAIRTIDDLHSVLHGVDRGAIPAHLRGFTEFAAVDPSTLTRTVAGLGLDPAGWTATGAIGGPMFDSALADAARIARAVHDAGTGPTVFVASGLPFHEAGASGAQELACFSASLLACLRACEREGVNPAGAVRLVECEIAADCDLVMTIAKLRAARVLWARIGEECRFADWPRLAARTSVRMMCAEDAGSNTLRTTTAALGAIIGGADAVTILPFTHALGQPDAAARRLARNTFHILAEESHIARVADPAAGSWAAETITGKLCRSAWEILRAIEAGGGIAAVLRSGALQAQVTASRVAFDEHQRPPRVGTSCFTEGRPARPEIAPWTSEPAIGEPLSHSSPIRAEGSS